MLDFTSALYLGLKHPSRSLSPWAQLTEGKPAALSTPSRDREVAQAIAELQGCEAGLLAPSTLHLFWELFCVLGEKDATLYVDNGAYPIARWGVERASSKGIPAVSFRHNDPDALQFRLLESGRRRKPIVVADGFCPSCGEATPIADYLKWVRRLGGYLVLDDTQALGIWGESPDRDARYGRGGGGSLRRSHAYGNDVVMVSSLAKGFGVPVASLAGSRALVRHFESRSESRVHSSPTSAVAVRAAEHALLVNKRQGDALRARLAQRVLQFRDTLASLGLCARGGLFPAQQFTTPSDADSRLTHARLGRLGVRTVLHAGRNGGQPRIGFLVTARHSLSDVVRAAETLARALDQQRNRNTGVEMPHGSLDLQLGTL